MRHEISYRFTFLLFVPLALRIFEVTALAGDKGMAVPLKSGNTVITDAEAGMNSTIRLGRLEQSDPVDKEGLTFMRSADFRKTGRILCQSFAFETPCHFPLNQTLTSGVVAPRESLLIYEGMTLEVYNDGSYAINFLVESPRTPVTFRLQLTLHDSGTDSRPAKTSTILLRPITIEQPQDLSRHEPSQTIHIRRSGFSYHLSQLLDESGRRSVPPFGSADVAPALQTDCRVQTVAFSPTSNNDEAKDTTVPTILERLQITRSGVARFGSIPERADYSLLDMTSVKSASQKNGPSK